MFTTMQRRLPAHLSFMACCLFLSAACGEDEGAAADEMQTQSELDVEEDVRELSATVGPAGGEIVGAATGSFAGVRLSIPPGALAEPTRITITAVGSAVPMLSDLAEGVGPGFAIEPAGLALELPAELTLPVSPVSRDLFLADAEECKIWMRDGDEWRAVDQVRADDTSVTVQTQTLDLALSGVQVAKKPIAFACDGVPGTTCLPLGCNTPGKFCLEQLEVTSKGQLAAAGNFLFVQGPQTGLARFDLDTNVLTTTPPASLSCLGLSGETFISDAMKATPVRDGSLWSGSCRFGFPGILENLEATDHPYSSISLLGRVENGEGDVATLISGVLFGEPTVIATQDAAGVVSKVAKVEELASGLVVGVPVDANTRVVADPDDPTGVWVLTNNRDDDDGRTRALVEVDGDGKIVRELDEDPNATIGGFPFGVPSLLVAHDSQLLTTTFDPPRILVLSVDDDPADLGEAVERALAVPVEGFEGAAFVRKLAVDDTGGIWAVKQQAGTPNKLLHYAPGQTKAQVLQIDGQVLDVVAASEGRVVIKVLLSNSTDRVLFTVRRV